jgi:hypothetical protein
VQVEGPVRLMAVQENGDRGDGDVGHRQRDDNVAPPGQIEQSGEHQAVRPCSSGARILVEPPSQTKETKSGLGAPPVLLWLNDSAALCSIGTDGPG